MPIPQKPTPPHGRANRERRERRSTTFFFSLLPLLSLSRVRFFLCTILLPTHLLLGPLSLSKHHRVMAATARSCNQTVAEQRPVVITPFTSSDLNLSSIFNCENGSFEVTWSGAVTVTGSIRIGRGTSVTIVGSYGSSTSNEFLETAPNDSAAVASTAFGPIFIVEEAELILKGMVVRGGNASSLVGRGIARGGGVYARDANLTIERCAVEDNFAEDSGGGIRASLSRVIVRETVVRRCDAGFKPEAGSEDASGEGGGIEVVFVWVTRAIHYHRTIHLKH